MDGASLTLRARLEAQVAARGDRPALIAAGTRLSYRALDAAANALAVRLRAAGAAPGTHVALILPPDARRLIGALAILKADCAYVPIDASLDTARAAELIAHARCSAVLSADGDDIAAAPIAALDPARTGAAYLRFTSGSTGAPKAILHGQLTALRLAEAFADSVGVRPDDRVSFFNPFWHTLVWGTLVAGAALHVFDLRAGPHALADWIDDEAISVYSSFPTAFRGFTGSLPPQRRLASVSRISLSGETLTAADIAAARRHFAPDCVLVNSYGASELGHITACAITPDSEREDASIPVGTPVAGVEILLLEETLRPAPTGESGEIAVRCAHLAAGYWERPDLTARSYVPDPAREGGVLYLTGDIGRLDGLGRLHVLGRKDRQLKVRGHRLQPDEIAAVLSTHPAVAEAAVAGFPHWSGDTRLAAYVVARVAQRPEPGELRAHVAARLPAYMVPLHIAVLDGLPRTTAGKIDWRALPAPDAGAAPPPGPAPAVSRALELQILQIWEEQLTARPIGLDDDFFELGGDSLAATEVALHLEALTGQTLPITTLFETPTIRALADRIEAGDPPRATITTVNGAGAHPPLFFFHPDSRTAHYGVAIARRLGDQQPVHIIGPRVAAANAPLANSFEAIGKAGAELVRDVQPDGPVAIAGFCNGALIAFETAQALLKAGRSVDVLVLVDPPSSHVLWRPLRALIAAIDGWIAPRVGRDDALAGAVGVAIHYAHRLRELAREPPARWREVVRLRVSRSTTARETTASHSEPDWYGALNDIGRRHLPRRIDAAMDVLLSEARGHNRYRPGRWHRVATRLAIQPLPGNHLGCISRESATLVAHLRARLAAHSDARRGG